jgi:magnesium chelatase family protein
MEIVAYAGRGYEGSLVHVEIDLRRGIPGIEIVGLPDNAVREARQRVHIGIRNSGFSFPRERILINLAPAGVRKEGASFDLPIAVALLLAGGGLRFNHASTGCRLLVLGELELSGRVRRVGGALAAVGAAMEEGVDRFLVPLENLPEISAAAGTGAVGIAELAELPRLLRLQQAGDLGTLIRMGRCLEVTSAPGPPENGPDFSELKGQPLLRRGMEIAAAGRHNLLLFGPPGSGKSMSAERYPSILPDLDGKESLEVTRIHSLHPAADLSGGIIRRPPVRTPHHSATMEGLVGGEKEERPGEAALAHNGVLFLDEALQFRENLLQSLREPVERGRVDISRSGNSYWFPARFQLLLATNACPCGRLGREDGGCLCTEKEIARYWRKLGAALIDRIDIRIPCSPVSPEQLLGPPGEASGAMRERVRGARAFRHHHASPPVPEGEAKRLFAEAVHRYSFSSRAAEALLQVARTIADLDGREEILPRHIAEAVLYRRYGDRDLFWRRL